MDINSLRDTVSNLTLYDLKAGVRKVQNGMSPVWLLDASQKLILDPSGDELHRDGGKGTAVSSVALDAYSDQDFAIQVREATNNEPWGASSTLMQEIANGTYSLLVAQDVNSAC